MTTNQLNEVSDTSVGSLDPKRYWALAVIGIAQLMIVLDASVVIVALPSAQHALHISIANRQWVMSAYTLVFGSLLLLGGRVADYLGRRRVFIIGLLGFGVASALAGLAQNSAMLFGARALQGGFAERPRAWALRGPRHPPGLSDSACQGWTYRGGLLELTPSKTSCGT